MGDAVEKLERMNRNKGAGRVFWVLATVYAVVVLATLLLTAPDLRRDGLAALPAMTLTLPTSLALMRVAAPIVPKSGVSAFISVTVASAIVNIGIAYLIARWQARRRGKTSQGPAR